ncbi:MAG: amidohydrolase family protein [Lewinella sp.]|uniref:amidohydrolase family protein n=1 Tax=Lewinella sp. TaxID=2004506 RepID=UPI003D6C1EEC
MGKVLCLSLALIYSCSFLKTATDPVYKVIKDVNVVDVVNGELLKSQTVVLKDSLIHFIGNEWLAPSNAQIITVDGSGKYLMPGMWDMHFHLAWDAGNDSLLFDVLLAHGITGVRDMGGDLAIQQGMKQKVAVDPTRGPAIFGAGPILDGNPPVMYDFTIPIDGTSTPIEFLLDSLVAAGSDFFKTYSLIQEPVVEAIAAYADEHELSFAGHLSEYIEPEKSIQIGQKSIEHLNRLDEIWQVDTARIIRIAELMKEEDTWLCPTLLIYEVKARMWDSALIQPVYEPFIHPFLQQEWQSSRARRLSKNTQVDWEKQERLFEQQKALVGFLHQQGVSILAGTDFAGMPYVYPGIGLQQEIQLLHEAGLSNAEALAAATINPALFMGTQDMSGTVAVGKYADLVLLRENPLEDIKAVAQIDQVFRKGRGVRVAHGGTR